MQKAKIQKILRDCGLTEKEAAIYLSALSLGSASVQDLATAADIKRTSTYPIIKNLVALGLLNIDHQIYKRRYVAASPQQLEELFRVRQQKLQESMPDLMAAYNLKATDSSIKYYQGKTAIRGIYNSLIEDVRPGDFYFILSNNDKFVEQDPEFFTNFFQRRAKRFKSLPAPSIDLRMLIVDSASALERKKMASAYAEKIKIFPAGTYHAVNSVVTPQRIVLHQLTLPIFAIVIENPNLIELQRQMYELIWNSIDRN